MNIAGIDAIQYNNSLRSNTDSKVKYNNTTDISQDSFVKTTATQPTKAQNVSFGSLHSAISEIEKFLKFLKEGINNFFIKMKLPKGAKQSEDGTWVAQEFCNREGIFPIMEHIKSFKDGNPWESSGFLRVTIYYPSTKNMKIFETRNDRFNTLKVISSDGKCTYTVLEPKSGGKIVYNGYNNKFQPISGVDQSITCLDKDNNILAQFNKEQIKKGSSANVDCTEDVIARSLLSVENLEDGPPINDFALGDFENIVQLMKYVVRRGLTNRY